jgi:putative dimethyl sulfoxide reductase chaperone
LKESDSKTAWEIKMNVKDLITAERARMDIYKGLSACYAIPETGLFTHMKHMERQLAFLGSGALIPITLMRSQIQNTGILDDLKVDYSRLFVGPYNLLAPPYGSVYLEGERKIMGESTIDVLRRYSDAGLDMSSEFKDTPDHIAAELEFIYYLVFRQIEAMFATAMDLLNTNLSQQRDFIKLHLGYWIGAFTEKVETHAETEFYRNLAAASKVFVLEELEHVTNLPITAPAEEAV